MIMLVGVATIDDESDDCNSKEATGIEVSASNSLSRKTRQRPRAILPSLVSMACASASGHEALSSSSK